VSTDTQWEIEVGDLNGDGHPDIAGCSGLNLCSPALNVWYSEGDGIHFDLQTYPAVIDYWSTGNGVAVGDLNGDGLDDAALTIPGNQPGALINVWHQLPDGTLSAPIVYDSYDVPEPLIIGDVNGDGWNDLVTLHGGWNQAGVYYYGHRDDDLSQE